MPALQELRKYTINKEIDPVSLKSLRQGKYHVPVLADRVVEFLITDSVNVVVDATLGDGGHASTLLSHGKPELRLIGIDSDPQSLESAKLRLQKYTGRCSFIGSNFRHVASLLADSGLTTVDAILADLGVSSRQIDLPERGFSYLDEGPLDMRLSNSVKQTASELVAALNLDQLVCILRDYGEERLARPIAKGIVLHRQRKAIRTTSDLRSVVESVVRGPHLVKSLARVFQAFRIAVNDELGALQDFLIQAFQCLSPEGRLAVIGYHSLEDRITKRFFNSVSKGCDCPPEFPICTCDKKSEAIILTRKPIISDKKETKQNPRARSAKMRVLQKR